MEVVHPPARQMAPAQARTMLRKLRDLNLAASKVAIDHDHTVSIDGCLSLDGPVEQGVRYRVRLQDGAEYILALRWTSQQLEIQLRGPERSQRRSLSTEFMCDATGRATSASLRVRVNPAHADGREIEHLLRRIVRGAFAA